MAVERRGRLARRTALSAGGSALLVLVLAQVFLPRIAADRVRSKLGRYGTVGAVSVSAWPAIELLWGKADSLTIHARSLTLSTFQIASLLAQVRGFTDVTVHAGRVTLRAPQLASGVSVSDARVFKRGSSVTASSTVTQAQLDGALPGGLAVQPLRSGPEGVSVRAGGALFGIGASIDVLVRPLEGNIVAEPEGVPFASLASLTVFSDAHLKVQRLALDGIGSPSSTYSVSVWAKIG